MKHSCTGLTLAMLLGSSSVFASGEFIPIGSIDSQNSFTLKTKETVASALEQNDPRTALGKSHQGDDDTMSESEEDENWVAEAITSGGVFRLSELAHRCEEGDNDFEKAEKLWKAALEEAEKDPGEYKDQINRIKIYLGYLLLNKKGEDQAKGVEYFVDGAIGGARHDTLQTLLQNPNIRRALGKADGIKANRAEAQRLVHEAFFPNRK